MILISIVSNVAGYAASKIAIAGLVKNSGLHYGIKAIDKVLVPLGVEICAWAIGDECQKYVEHKSKEIKEVRDEVVAIRCLKRDLKELEEQKKEESKVVNNIFDKKEEE